MLQTSLYELLTFFFYGPLIFALIIAIFVGCLTGIYQWLKSEKTPLPYESVNISRSSAVDAWSAIYTQAANANLEITKSFITVSGAVLVAATASIAIWPGAHAPITAVIVALIGLFSTVFPLASLRDESQKRLSMAASFLKEQPTGEILPYFLPSTVPYGKMLWSSRMSMGLSICAIMILTLHAITASHLDCAAKPSGVKVGSFIVCAPLTK